MLFAVIGIVVGPISAVSFSNQAGDAERCKELGIAAYLNKPVCQAKLREAVIRVLDAR